MIAVRVLHAGEDRELAPRAQVNLERADAVDQVVVHALGVLSIPFAARLPVAFEDVAGIAGEGRELGCGGLNGEDQHRREHNPEKPGTPGEWLTHGASILSWKIREASAE